MSIKRRSFLQTVGALFAAKKAPVSHSAIKSAPIVTGVDYASAPSASVMYCGGATYCGGVVEITSHDDTYRRFVAVERTRET